MLGGKQGDDGMRTYTNVVGRKASPEAGNTFFGQGLCNAVRNTFVWENTFSIRLLFLHLGLDVIERQRSASSAYSRYHGGRKLNLARLIGTIEGGKTLLNFLIGHKHSNVERRSSHHGGNGTSPEASDTLFSKSAAKGIKNVLVVTSLSLGQSSIGLHTYESEIARVSNERTETTGSQ